mmetsp:Transcript_2919/g.4405  ORF Transcript_2919/g.4405 Transcript_2919/m.4405 type:complete len:320 (+) Transcript_2919:258-1217(+)
MRTAALVTAAFSWHSARAQTIDCSAVWSENGMDGYDVSEFCSLFCSSETLGQNTIPTTIGSVVRGTSAECPASYETIGIECEFLAGSPGTELTGTLPTQLGDISFKHDLNFAGNSLTGSIPQNVRQNTNLVRLNIERNEMTGSLANYLDDWHQDLEVLRLAENAITGAYDDPKLFDFLTNREKLSEFSLSLQSSTGCIDQSEVQRARRLKNFPAIFLVTPDESTCAPTPGPTTAPQTLPPVDYGTPPPTPELGGGGGSPISESTRGPTSAPSPSPTQYPPTPKPASPTPRTLAPSNSVRLQTGIVLVIAGLFALLFGGL